MLPPIKFLLELLPNSRIHLTAALISPKNMHTLTALKAFWKDECTHQKDRELLHVSEMGRATIHEVSIFPSPPPHAPAPKKTTAPSKHMEKCKGEHGTLDIPFEALNFR